MNDTASLNRLAERLQRGDQRAGEEIFNHFAPAIYRYFLARTNQKETAQDLTQEAFMKLIQHSGQYKSEQGNFSAWFWQIARNLLIDSFRQKKPTQSLDAMQDSGLDVVDPVERVLPSVELQRVLKLVETLPSDERELFELYFISDISYADLAKILDKSEANLRVTIHRLKKKITKLAS